MKLLIIKADINDADYIHKIIEIEKDLGEYYNGPLIEKVARAISESKQRHNWCMDARTDFGDKDPYNLYKDILTDEEIEEFDENYVPHTGEYDIHTIKSITIFEVTEKIPLYGTL